MPAGTAVILGLGVVWIWILSDLVSVTLVDDRTREEEKQQRRGWLALVGFLRTCEFIQ